MLKRFIAFYFTAHFTDVVAGAVIVCDRKLPIATRISFHAFAGVVFLESFFANIASTSQAVLRLAIGSLGRANASRTVSIRDHRRRTFAASTVCTNPVCATFAGNVHDRRATVLRFGGLAFVRLTNRFTNALTILIQLFRVATFLALAVFVNVFGTVRFATFLACVLAGTTIPVAKLISNPYMIERVVAVDRLDRTTHITGLRVGASYTVHAVAIAARFAIRIAGTRRAVGFGNARTRRSVQFLARF